MRQQIKVFCIILLSMFTAGWYFVSDGVLIPYYSQATGYDQTDYSFIFIVRSLSYISGTIAIKYLSDTFSVQQLCIGYFSAISVSLFICSINYSFLNLAIMLFISGFCFVAVNVIAFSLTMKIFANNKPEFWMVVLGVVFGFGATLSPLITIQFQLHTYKVRALFSALQVPLYMLYPPPNMEDDSQTTEPKQKISRRIQLYICLVMMIFPAQQSGMAGWMPTYSIKAGVSDTEGAAIYSFLFWLPNAVAGVVWALLTQYTVTQRMKVMQVAVTLTSILLVVLQYFKFYSLVCILGPFIFGCMLASFFPFCMSLPIDNGFQCTLANNANFMLANCIGQGLLNGSFGYLMQLFGFQSLIIVLMVSCLISFGCFQMIVRTFKEQQRVQKYEQQMMLFNTSV